MASGLYSISMTSTAGAGRVAAREPPVLRDFSVRRETTSASGTSSGISLQEPRTVPVRTDSSLREWRRRETVSLPRENDLSESVEVAIQSRS